MMLIHKICMAFRGLGNLRNVDIVINEIAAMLLHMGKKFYNIEMISTECSCTDVFFNLFFFPSQGRFTQICNSVSRVNEREQERLWERAYRI